MLVNVLAEIGMLQSRQVVLLDLPCSLSHLCICGFIHWVRWVSEVSLWCLVLLGLSCSLNQLCIWCGFMMPDTAQPIMFIEQIVYWFWSTSACSFSWFCRRTQGDLYSLRWGDIKCQERGKWQFQKLFVGFSTCKCAWAVERPVLFPFRTAKRRLAYATGTTRDPLACPLWSNSPSTSWARKQLIIRHDFQSEDRTSHYCLSSPG